MKDFAQKSRRNYNLIAENYDETLDGKFTERFKELLLDEIQIEANENILDVACGNGSLLKMISNKCNIKGYGIDISERMIEYAERKCPDMTFQVGGCEDTAFNNQMFDVITVCAAYHHFPDVKAFAKEAYRILRPHGRLYIAEVYYPFLIRLLCNPFIPLSKAGDVKFYSPQEIQRNFEAYGFKQNRFIREGHIQIIGMLRL